MLSGSADEKMRAVMAARENSTMAGNETQPPAGTGKNAAKNKRNREKAKQKRLAAGQEADQEAGAEAGTSE